MSTSREKRERFETGIMSGFEDDISSVISCSFKQKPFFSRDRKFLKSLMEVGVNVKGVDAINNMIRKYFQEFSQMFLQPLNRYFDSLVVGVPSDMSLSKLRPYPEIRPFRQADFLKAIEITG
jgi:HD superfamily phosphohydrolase